MAKNVQTFRISDDNKRKLSLIETELKETMGEDVSRSYVINHIIETTYDRMFNEHPGKAPSIDNEKIIEAVVETMNSIAEQQTKKILERLDGNFKDLSNGDIKLSMVELLEDVELILKLLPYSSEYRNEDNSEKSREILTLVQSKSMFRKYVQAKAKSIIQNNQMR